MSNEEQMILNIRVNYDDAIRGIAKYKAKVAELKEAQQRLQRDLRDGRITHDEYATSLVAVNEQSKAYQTTIRELSREVQNNIKTEREQNGSLRALRAELANATKEYDALSRSERTAAKGEELKKHINDITNELKTAEAATQRFQRSVGSYEESIKNALGVNTKFGTSIMGLADNGKGLQGVFVGAADEAKAFGSTLLGLLSNPVFIALAGIAGAGVAFKWFYDYNKGLLQSTRLTREFLGLTGDRLKAVRDEIQATADTYGKDFKETLEAVDVLTSQYGYNAAKALDIINKGFQAGADLNGDMIAKIKQYAPAFHDASISGEELVGIIQQTRSGIFSDSGLALIQIASKKIREMSSGTAAALDGIGISSKKMQRDLETGAISTFDAIKLVSAKLREIPQNSNEAGAVLKDVFGKQGANAGLKMIEQLDNMEIGLDKLQDATGGWGKKMKAQKDATAELNRTMSALFDMSDKGFGGMIAQVKLLATKWLTALLRGVIDTINYFIDLYNESTAFRALVQSLVVNFKNLWAAVKLAFNLIIDGAKNVGRSLKAIGQIIEGIVTFSAEKIKAGQDALANSFVTSFKDGFNDIKGFAVETMGNTMDAVNEVIKNKKVNHIEIPAYVMDATAANADGGKGKGKLIDNGGKGKGKDGKVSAAEQAKKEAEEVRKAEDLLTQIVEQTAEQRRTAIITQYDRQIEDIKRRLAHEKGLTIKAREAMNAQIILLEEVKQKRLTEFDDKINEERIKREQTYIQNMLASVEKGTQEEYNYRIKAINEAYKLEQAEIQRMVISEEEKTALLASVNEKYYKQEQDAYKEYHNHLLDEQKKAIEERYKQKVLETEIDSQGLDEVGIARLQMEEKQALLEAAQQREGETIEQFNLRKLQMERDFVMAKKNLADKEVEMEQAKAQALITLTNGVQQVAEAFSEDSKGMAALSKVLALAQIAIQTGVAIAKMTAAESGKGIAGLATMAAGIAGVLANIATAIKTVKSAKFASGGLVVGPGSGTSDSISAQLSNGESVLTAAATRMFAPALSAFNQIGGGVPIASQGNASPQIGEEFLARAVAKGMMLAPRPVVSVEEITAVQNRVQTIERLATLK
jgi:hypothetical protein|uniref:Minor tail protein n=1 Tax=Siphoviridae sp. cttU829 TaxID=2823605 RepID=A0A8S5LC86_9CAUD|nr:MAG TPA: minor tail protein [Siphoviridae sp. cttU829]